MRNIPGFRWDARKKRARFDLRTPGSNGGVRRRKSVNAATMADALEEWKKFRLEVESGRRAYGSCKTLEEYVTSFWHLRKPRIAAKTYTSDQTSLKRILPIFGNHRMDRINAALVRDLVAEMKSKRYEPETINNTSGSCEKCSETPSIARNSGGRMWTSQASGSGYPRRRPPRR